LHALADWWRLGLTTGRRAGRGGGLQLRDAEQRSNRPSQKRSFFHGIFIAASALPLQGILKLSTNRLVAGHILA
jgi:hypothetical protein